MAKEFTEHDLELAKELGGLTKTIYALDDKVSNIIRDHSGQLEKLWEKTDKAHKIISWIIGVGVGSFSLLGIVLAIVKSK